MKFFLVLSNDPVPSKISGFECRSVPMGAHTLSVGFSERAVLLESEDGFLLRETTEREGAPGPQRFGPAQVQFSKREGTLDLEAGATTARGFYYHGRSDGCFICASDIGLLRSLGVSLEEDREQLPEYFLFRCVMTPRTLYRGVSELARASLRIEAISTGFKIHDAVPHESLPSESCAPTDVATAAEESLELFERELALLPESPDRVCVLLSGGMDSSFLFRLCQRRLGLDQSYSSGYPFEAEEQNREKRYAITAAHALGSNHHYEQGDVRSLAEAIIRSIELAGEPPHHQQTAMMSLLLDRGVPAERDLVVMGTGASTAFGSETQLLLHQYANHRFLAAAGRTPFKRAWLAGAARFRRGRRIAKVLKLLGRLDLPLEHPDHILWSVGAYGSREWIRNRFAVPETDWFANRRATMAPYQDRPLIEQVAALDAADKTPLIWSRMLSASGRMALHPFMQGELRHHALRLPIDYRLGSHKQFLRDISARVGVPDFILTRQKSGFGVRRNDWALKGGPFEALVPIAAQAIGEEELRNLQSTDPERAMTFWTLLTYGIWKRIGIGGESANDLIAELRARS